jgi:predicted RNase H-like HicB family nuclease
LSAVETAGPARSKKAYICFHLCFQRDPIAKRTPEHSLQAHWARNGGSCSSPYWTERRQWPKWNLQGIVVLFVYARGNQGDCFLRIFNAILAMTFVGWFTKPIRLRSGFMTEQSYTIETEQEIDGRWIAEILELPGVLAYGSSQQEAIANTEALALRVIADRIEESKIGTSKVLFANA